jgi:hypothetical protein
MLGKPTGARYEISINGKPRSYRDTKPVALPEQRGRSEGSSNRRGDRGGLQARSRLKMRLDISRRQWAAIIASTALSVWPCGVSYVAGEPFWLRLCS